jgi:hypothetical protein
MATPTYTPIQTQTLVSDAANINLNSIPSTYTDLRIVLSGKFSASQTLWLQFNGDTSSNYSYTRIFANGSAVSSYRESSITQGKLASVSSTNFGITLIDIQNYANTTTYKTALCRGNSDQYVSAYVTLWRKTPEAITSIKLGGEDAGDFKAGTTVTLYGIANAAIGAPKATGGIITYDNTYYYHTFGASGTFTPQQSLTADILVVAGGGSGGTYYRGGGGGAGGVVALSSQSLTATGYTVTVGAGATGGGIGVNGNNSQFGALTAAVGGGGGGDYGYNSNNGRNGGSGGGGSNQSSTDGSGGTATSGQGYAGGSALAPNGGGGGGAGAIGGTATSSVSGAGGNGSSTYSSWLSVTGIGQNVSGTYYIAGGGSGAPYSPAPATAGVAGYGGGGVGVGSGTGGAGLTNTGGGGGGTNYPSAGGNGGSGVVIIRYLKA